MPRYSRVLVVETDEDAAFEPERTGSPRDLDAGSISWDDDALIVIPFDNVEGLEPDAAGIRIRAVDSDKNVVLTNEESNEEGLRIEAVRGITEVLVGSGLSVPNPA